jgi:hypothetical protein
VRFTGGINLKAQTLRKVVQTMLAHPAILNFELGALNLL